MIASEIIDDTLNMNNEGKSRIAFFDTYLHFLMFFFVLDNILSQNIPNQNPNAQAEIENDIDMESNASTETFVIHPDIGAFNIGPPDIVARDIVANPSAPVKFEDDVDMEHNVSTETIVDLTMCPDDPDNSQPCEDYGK